MDGMRSDSQAARFIAASLVDEDFTLVDVGCSGGVDRVWRVFGPALRVFGFDISETAIAQLQAADPNAKATYVAGRVAGVPGREAAYGLGAAHLQVSNPWYRLAAYRTQQLRDDPAAAPIDWQGIGAGYDPTTPLPSPALAGGDPGPRTARGDADEDLLKHNLWNRTRLAQGEVLLPDFFAARGVRSIDFVKIDVDGPDYGILESLEAPLADCQVLGVGLEVNFIGTDADGQHSFHNTDRFMRRQGFQLFGLSVRRYSSAALPFMYTDVHPFAHQGVGGRPLQGDALYVRDFGFEATAHLAAAYGDDKLLKLAALFAVAGLADQAAEVLLQFRARLAGRLDIDRALDLLTAEVQQEQGAISSAQDMARGYDAYMAAFEADSPGQYGSQARWWAWREDLWAKAQRLQEAEAGLSAALAELDSIKASRAWRLARGLSRAAARLTRRGA